MGLRTSTPAVAEMRGGLRDRRGCQLAFEVPGEHEGHRACYGGTVPDVESSGRPIGVVWPNELLIMVNCDGILAISIVSYFHMFSDASTVGTSYC